MSNPKKLNQETKKCVCGEELCLGGAEVEIGGVCHRPNNPCYHINHQQVNRECCEKCLNKERVCEYYKCPCHTKTPVGKSECCWAKLKEIGKDKICTKCHKVFYHTPAEQTGEWEEEFDKEFVNDNGKDVEQSFKDPNGDVYSVKSFIQKQKEQSYEEGQLDEKVSNSLYGEEVAEKVLAHCIGVINREMVIHAQLAEEWTGIKMDGTKERMNPHTEKYEVLEDLKAKLTNSKETK